MKDNPIEEILKSLPAAAKQLKQEADNVGRTLLENKLKQADVVTRAEFEEQQALLQAALEKLQQLETLIAQQQTASKTD